MRIINDLKEELSYYKDVLSNANIFKRNNSSKIDDEPLFVEAMFINDIEYSDDLEFIVSRLNNCFRMLEVKYSNNVDAIDGFIGEIRRIIDNIINSNGLGFLCKYNMVIKDNNRYYKIVLVNQDKVVMQIDIVTMDNGRFLCFDAKYYLDLLNSNFNSKMDTTVIVSLNDISNGEKCGIYSVYDVDLLNGNLEVSDKMLADRLVSSFKLPLSSNNRKKY